MTKYIFLFLISLFLFTGTECKKKPPVAPPDDTVDTTSHNFTFTTYTFGGNAGSSGFKDVAIINDTDIWVVGSIYTDSGFYNAVHWDGKVWELMKVPYNYQGQLLYNAINTIFAFSSKDIWFGIGNLIHWNGSQFDPIDNSNVLGSHSTNRMWGVNNSNLFTVGDSGKIAHYSGSSWTKQVSGTDIDLRDIWGTPDGSVVWACGWSNDNTKSVLLKYNGQAWQTIWDRDTVFTSPYGYFVTSVWGINSLVAATGRGVFQDTTQVVTLPWFPYRIRGSAKNNVAVVGDNGMIWHWSGEDWKMLNDHSAQPLYSVAVSRNKIVAVGSDFTVGLGAALIYLGQRK
jgi:hypothetical protein